MAEYATAREFLSAVWKQNMEVKRCMWDVNLLRNRCERITACLESGRGGGGDPHRDQSLAALADKRTELLELEQELEQQERLAEDFLARIVDERKRVILKLRYVEHLKWTEICSKLEEMRIYYSERQIYNLHRQAVQEAEQLFLNSRELSLGA